MKKILFVLALLASCFGVTIAGTSVASAAGSCTTYLSGGTATLATCTAGTGGNFHYFAYQICYSNSRSTYQYGNTAYTGSYGVWSITPSCPGHVGSYGVIRLAS